MIKRIKDKIRRYGFDDFIVSRVVKKETQRYLLRHNIESEREISSEQYEITVYLDHFIDGKKYRGSYTFIFKPSENLDQYLNDARVGIALVKNRPYSMTAAEPFPEVKVFDSRIAAAKHLMNELTETIYRHSPDHEIRLSSAEIFLTDSHIELHTSKGIEAQKRKGKIEVDITILTAAGSNDAEINFNLVRRNCDDLDLPERISDYKTYVRDMTRVQIPKSGKAVVVFPPTDFYNLFAPVIFHGSARAKDAGISRFNIDQPIMSKPAPENAISISSNGLLAYGTYTDSFDAEGVRGQDCLVVDKGVLKRFWATKQYADYLGIQPSGSFKNLVVSAGQNNPLNTGEYYQIIQFSDFSPDALTGDFVAEIRFGYLHTGKSVVPVKGGSVTGNLFDRLSNIRLSGDEIFEGDYKGPSAIALDDLTIAGN